MDWVSFFFWRGGFTLEEYEYEDVQARVEYQHHVLKKCDCWTPLPSRLRNLPPVLVMERTETQKRFVAMPYALLLMESQRQELRPRESRITNIPISRCARGKTLAEYMNGTGPSPGEQHAIVHLRNVHEGEREGRTYKEKDKEGNSGYFFRVVVTNEETKHRSKKGSCHLGKDESSRSVRHC